MVDAILLGGEDVPQDAVPPTLLRPLCDARLDASAVAATATPTARAVSTLGSAIVDNVNV